MTTDINSVNVSQPAEQNLSSILQAAQILLLYKAMLQKNGMW